MNRLSGCPYFEIKSEHLCQLYYEAFKEIYIYINNLKATSELIFTSKNTEKQVKVKIPSGSVIVHFNGNKVLIDGEIKASLDKEETYFLNGKGHFYYSEDKCILNLNQEIKPCQIIKNETQYQKNSADFCQILQIYRNENVQLTIDAGKANIALSFYTKK